jgi:hypothetical protein
VVIINITILLFFFVSEKTTTANQVTRSVCVMSSEKKKIKGQQTPTKQTEQDKQENADEFYNYYGEIKQDSYPIIYSENYNITFIGLEKLHPFGMFVLLCCLEW